ncbi:unnamed protein product [Blepharisma stoltei]|uniref:Uncharacterized protein n=1 Tax=Blepharisma stoltei TaxID=1481888 RepID=A0AAU9JK56_9CILI|nr:unnamed protein product [Blepharisma stoltei]
MAFEDDTCVYYDEDAYIYYSKECSGDKLCIYDLNSQNKTCKDDKFSLGISSIGETCKKSAECDPIWSRGCNNWKCQGVSAGQSCRSNYQCMPGTYCLIKNVFIK